MPNWSQSYFRFPGLRLASTILNYDRSLSEFCDGGVSVNKLVLCAATWLTLAGMARAQDPQEPPPNPEMQRQELVNLEKENARAIQLHNPTFFRAAYSDDFHGVSRYGETVSKAGIIRELQSLPLEFDTVVSSDAQVRMFRDAAYVLSLRSEVGRANGKKFYNQYRILRVYVNTPRGWRIVSQLETKLVTDASH